ncbi:hypothetical protein [Gracilibacillus saliphilus]|uniref:hypothetical protein n=1 Tax=Gracilibacillus saliphilus TaxID=543890 RepID=UPI0013D1A606|nr:hypothetical protein [Gracilibacillus saliphilus]
MIKAINTVAFASLVLILSACQDYQGEYIKWSEQVDKEPLTDRLEENDIPYKIKDDIILIPEDAVNDAVNCCS